MILKHTAKKYSWVFNTENGFFIRSGETLTKDPLYSPRGPEIADIEISTICHGPTNEGSAPCKFCYKSNNHVGSNMTLDTFKIILDNINPENNLTQVALGIGDIDANPDLFDIMEYCRSKNIIPNITINGARLTSDIVNKLQTLCGGISVSHYGDELCFNAIDQLLSNKPKNLQINIHKILSKETFDDCIRLKQVLYEDPKYKNIAIIFLLLKPVGSRNNLSVIRDIQHYSKLYSEYPSVRIGFDSCSAPISYFFSKRKIEHCYIEPCESTLFSCYINVDGISFPCSFVEQLDVYNGMDLSKPLKNPLNEWWFGEEYNNFRNKVLNTQEPNGCRYCPYFDIYPDQFHVKENVS